MNCLDCQALLQRKLDGESLTDTAALEQHLAGCPPCREQHQLAQAMLDALRLRPHVLTPVNLAGTVTSRVLFQRQRRLFRRVYGTLALAASILLAIFAGSLWWNHAPVQPGPDLVEKKQPLPDQEPSLEDSMAEARKAVASLTNQFAEQTRDQAKVFLVAANPFDLAPALAPPPQLDEPLEPVASSLRQTTQAVGEGVNTVTRSARRALAFFVNDLSPSIGVQ